jgi:hypothetical protein
LSVSEIELTQLQRAETKLNIFLHLSEMVDGVGHAGEFIQVITLTESELFSDIMDVFVSAVMKTSDSLAFLSLRHDSGYSIGTTCDNPTTVEFGTTIGQKCLCVLFQELLNESRIRAMGGHDEVTKKFLTSRIRRVRGAMHILTRLGAVWSEVGQSSPTNSPIGEYSLLIPSIFGLLKELMAIQSDDPFPSLVKDMHESGDLFFLKELQTTIPGFEIETSQWPILRNSL